MSTRSFADLRQADTVFAPRHSLDLLREVLIRRRG